MKFQVDEKFSHTKMAGYTPIIDWNKLLRHRTILITWPSIPRWSIILFDSFVCCISFHLSILVTFCEFSYIYILYITQFLLCCLKPASYVINRYSDHINLEYIYIFGHWLSKVCCRCRFLNKNKNHRIRKDLPSYIIK